MALSAYVDYSKFVDGVEIARKANAEDVFNEQKYDRNEEELAMLAQLQEMRDLQMARDSLKLAEETDARKLAPLMEQNRKAQLETNLINLEAQRGNVQRNQIEATRKFEASALIRESTARNATDENGDPVPVDQQYDKVYREAVKTENPTFILEARKNYQLSKVAKAIEVSSEPSASLEYLRQGGLTDLVAQPVGDGTYRVGKKVGEEFVPIGGSAPLSQAGVARIVSDITGKKSAQIANLLADETADKRLVEFITKNDVQLENKMTAKQKEFDLEFEQLKRLQSTPEYQEAAKAERKRKQQLVDAATTRANKPSGTPSALPPPSSSPAVDAARRRFQQSGG